jgi:hypothetical protein
MLTTAAAPHVYVESDLLEGQTLVEWRRARSVPSRRRFHLRFWSAS